MFVFACVLRLTAEKTAPPANAIGNKSWLARCSSTAARHSCRSDRTRRHTAIFNSWQGPVATCSQPLGRAFFGRNLLARINLWTFSLPGLRSRAEKVEPNFDFELDRFAEKAGRRVTFNKEAREKFLSFALSPAALWANKKRAGCLLLGTGPMLLSEAMNSDRSFLANH